jgi:hypothetical protein
MIMKRYVSLDGSESISTTTLDAMARDTDGPCVTRHADDKMITVIWPDDEETTYVLAEGN